MSPLSKSRYTHSFIYIWKSAGYFHHTSDFFSFFFLRNANFGRIPPRTFKIFSRNIQERFEFVLVILFGNKKALDLYYELTKQVTQCFVEGKDPFPELMTNENVETINNSLKWKLSLSVLKRIDTVTTHWSSSLNKNRTSLLLEHPIISEQVMPDKWLWKEKFNSFPTRQVPDCPEIQSPLFGHGKVQLKSDAVLHRLARFTDCINSGKFFFFCCLRNN